MNHRTFRKFAVLPAVLFVFGTDAGNLCAEETSVIIGSRTLPMAPLGPHNPWPHFRFQIPEAPVRVSADLSAEDRAGIRATPSSRGTPLLHASRQVFPSRRDD